MAFQTGSQVRPELGRMDYSGFTQAAGIQAQMLADLGAAIGGGIQMHQQKKAQKAMDQQADAFLLNASQQQGALGQSLRDLGIIDAETAGVARQSLGGSANVMKLASEFMQEADGGQGPVTGAEMKNTLDILGIKQPREIKVKGNGIIKIRGKKLDPTSIEYRTLTETKGGQALLRAIDPFAGFSVASE